MDCQQIRDAFVKGEMPSEAEVAAHVQSCPQCHELFEHDAKLGRSLASQAAASSSLPDDFFSRVEASIERETGPRAWLRSRPTRLRFQFIALSVLLLVVVGGVIEQRADLAEYPLARQILLLGGYFVAILIAVGKELSLSVRRAALADHLGLLLGALALPFLVAFIPATEAGAQMSVAGAGGCFIYGALLTLPTALLLWAFDRDDRPSLRTVCLSAAALGLSANLMLELHCPSGNAIHLLLGHTSIGVLWFAAWYWARWFTRRSEPA